MVNTRKTSRKRLQQRLEEATTTIQELTRNRAHEDWIEIADDPSIQVEPTKKKKQPRIIDDRPYNLVLNRIRRDQTSSPIRQTIQEDGNQEHLGAQTSRRQRDDGTFITVEEKIWGLDETKRKTFMQMHEENERLIRENEGWCRKTAEIIKWAKRLATSESIADRCTDWIARMPRITDKRQRMQLNRELNLTFHETYEWEDPIQEYIVTPSRRKQEHQREASQYKCQQGNRIENWDSTTEEDYPTDRGCRSRRETHSNEDRKYSQRVPEKSHDNIGMRTHNVTYRRYDESGTEKMERSANKIKAMEILIRVNDLEYTKETQPRQWLELFTEVCETQDLSFEDRIELMKMALKQKRDWVKQNYNFWGTWTEVQDAFKTTFCKTKKDAEILQEIFETYSERSEDMHQYISKMRSKFSELKNKMSSRKQIDIIMPKLPEAFQRELNTMGDITTYQQLTEAIAIAETRIANIRKSREHYKKFSDRRKTNRIRNAQDSVYSSSEADSEPGKIRQIKERSDRRSRTKLMDKNDKKVRIVSENNRNNRYKNFRQRSSSRESERSNTSKSSTSSVRENYQCYNCGVKGDHFIKHCNNKRVDLCIRCGKIGTTADSCCDKEIKN